MAMTHACPDLARYQSLASGLLSSPESESLLSHLAGCDSCVRRLEGLSQKDSLVELIRQARAGDDPPGAEMVARLVERLRKLRPNAEVAQAASGPIAVPCPSCGKKLRAKIELAGKKVKCPNCQAMLTVPDAPVAGEAPTVLPATTAAGSPVGPANSQGVSVLEATGAANQPRPHDIEPELCKCLAPAQAPDELGRLGPYRVLQVLGAGGMGVVYRAEDPQLKRPVALKAILPTWGANESARKRFLREAQAAAAINHDNIVHIYQVGEDRGVPFMAMQFLDGESLEARLKRERRLPTAEMARIARETAEGLAAAHERGLIHRDIKPPNLWLEGAKRRVKILDFGVARVAGDEAHLTQTGAIIGTPAYMAPEQAGAEPVDHRCDLFSLGCVLYRMATGEMPFKGSNTISILAALVREDPPAPASLNPKVPAELSDLVMGLLQKDPAKRPASAHEVVERLTAIERTLSREPGPPSARAGTSPAAAGGAVRTRRDPRSHPNRVAALIAAAVVLLGGIVTAALIIVRTPEGDYFIETDDPDFVFHVNKGASVTLEDRKTKRAYQLKVLRREKGEFDLQVADDAEHVFETKIFTIRRGDRVRLKAWFARKQDASPSTPQVAAPARKQDATSSTQQGSAAAVAADDRLKEVAAVRPDQQLQAVMDRLKALNPGFDGKETHVYSADGNAVIELHLCTDKVADISPVRDLTRLQKLTCAGTGNGDFDPHGKLASLSALTGMKLTWLDCGFNSQLSDLGPLKDMPLDELHCYSTKVSDLSPLKGMKLKVLRCQRHPRSSAYVSDLSPLAGMPLEVLDISYQHQIPDLSPLAHTRLRTFVSFYTRVRDLSPLAGLPLEHLGMIGNPVSDLTPLKNIQSLNSLDLVETLVKDLSPLKGLGITRLRCGGTPVKDLSPLRGLRLTVFACFHTQVSDLTPLKGMPLRQLWCNNTPVSDLTPLKGMPLEVLNILATRVSDLALLKELPLKQLRCDFKPGRDAAILRSIKTLETINERPAKEVLK